MNSAPPLRTLLVLGRVAGLPTVWSNTLAGWWLGGGGNFWKLPLLLLGATALYTAGTFLNDAFDADSDRQRRTERPVPAGKIPVARVWRHGFTLLAAGVLLLAFCGKAALLGAVCLAVFILLYNLTHQLLTTSPWLMGGCRFWVYFIAGAAGADGLNGGVIFCGVALAFYATGADYFTRRKVMRGAAAFGPLLLLAGPVAMAMLLNTGDFRRDAIWISLVLLLWLARCLRTLLLSGEVNRKWTAANLIAGIALVDWLAVAPQIPHLASAVVFLALFGLTKWLQKIAPSA